MYRWFPRLILIAFAIFLMAMGWATIDWIIHIDPGNMSDVKYTAALGVPAALLTILTKFFSDMYGNYMKNGVNLEKNNPAVSTMKMEGTVTPVDRDNS